MAVDPDPEGMFSRAVSNGVLAFTRVATVNTVTAHDPYDVDYILANVFDETTNSFRVVEVQ